MALKRATPRDQADESRSRGVENKGIMYKKRSTGKLQQLERAAAKRAAAFGSLQQAWLKAYREHGYFSPQAIAADAALRKCLVAQQDAIRIHPRAVAEAQNRNRVSAMGRVNARRRPRHEMNARQTRRVAAKKTSTTATASAGSGADGPPKPPPPPQLETAYSLIGHNIDRGEVGIIIAHDPDLDVLEVGCVPLDRALEMARENEAWRIHARLNQAPPAGSEWALLAVDGRGLTLLAIERAVRVNANGGAA